MTARVLLSLAVAAFAALASAPVAGAATAFQIGAGGKDPSAAVDAATGALHAVWADDPETRIAHYCRVPRGASACDLTRDLTLTAPDAFTVDQPQIVRAADGTLYVVTARYVGSDTWMWKSTDNGVTWAPSVKIYEAPVGTDATDAVLGPQPGEITIPVWNSGRRVFSAKLDGSEAAIGTYAELPAAAPPISFLIYDLAVAVAPDGSLIATADNDTREPTGPVAVWRVAPGGDPSALGSWSAAPTVVAAGSEARVAGGSSGVFLATNIGSNTFNVRTLQPGTSNFGAAVAVAGGNNAQETELTVGPSGAIGFLWRTNGNPNYELWLARSIDGSSFGAPTRISDDPGLIIDPQAALAQDGGGFVVWESAGKLVKAASTDPLPATTPAPAGPSVPAAPTTTTPTTHTVTSTVPGASITFGVPAGCVKPGSTFKVTLAWKRKKRKGNKFVKVTRADFYIGAKVVKKDRKAPFVQTLKVTASAKPGSTITLRARAFIKVKSGRAPKKSIKAQIRVCP